MWNYTNSVIDHFTNPRNVGEIEDANAVGEVGSLACGDALKLFLKIDPASKKIVDAKFKTFGCASAIASASALTEMVKGITLEEAGKITNDDIAKFLGGLPEQKMHCSVMGREALEAALSSFSGEEVKKHTENESPIICKCFWVDEDKIRRNIRENHLTTVEQITNYTKAGGGCGGCLPDLDRILREEMARAGATAGSRIPGDTETGKPKKMTTIQKIALIQKIISEEIAQPMRNDGGDIELVDVDGNRVIVRLKGACSHCMGASATLQHLVQQKLRERVSPDIEVEEARDA
ncbi:MAG: Fe-S cluster assembly protein NifU [Candidatus Riflebacteria bacterium]|nr:Fe-S cluster assembly protein NifU [Candidatus Riflebacteria bacterium]